MEPYRTTYAAGWDKLRLSRFEKAKELGIISHNAELNDVFPQFQKWEELSGEDQEMYTTDMAVTAGMIEAMDLPYRPLSGLFDRRRLDGQHYFHRYL